MQFYKINLKSTSILVPWIVTVSGSITILIAAIKTSQTIYYVLFGFLFLVLLMLYALCFVTKIRIESEYIAYDAPGRRVAIPWDKIKSAGVVSIYKGFISEVDVNDYNKFSLWGQKIIYVSTNPNFAPKNGQHIDDSYIEFHWRKNAWQEIQRRLHKQ